MPVGAVDRDLDARRSRFQLTVAAGVIGVAVGIEQVIQVRPVEPDLLQGWLDGSQRRVARATVDQRELRTTHEVQVDCIALIRGLHAKDALEFRMAGDRRQLHVEVAPRDRNAGRGEEVEEHGKQGDDRGVMRHRILLARTIHEPQREHL